MQKLDGQLKFSPSDLITFMDSKFDSWMDRWKAEFPDEVSADEPDASHAILQKLGNKHEENFLNQLKSDGIDIAEIPVAPSEISELETIKAMRAGRQVIYQGVLSAGNFAGRTDFLYKVNGASQLGDYHYEVWDTKLAKKSKPYFVIQLCCYAEMLETIQCKIPDSVSIVLGDSTMRTFRTSDYFFYYKQLKAAFLAFHDTFDKTEAPEDSKPGTFSKWKSFGERLLEERDDLCRVANIRKALIQRLKNAGISRLNELATTDLKVVPKMNSDIFDKLKSQARLQVQTVREQKTCYEFLPKVAHKGFHLLPPSSAGDVFFDMEGYPHVEGGLEYLFGASYEVDGKLLFKDWWAHDRGQEKRAFEGFIDWVMDRWHTDPSMHIYHYASYEVAAARRLAGRYTTRINEVDQLLQNEIFVDLFQIVRQGLLVGEPSYSIKKIEHLYRGNRAGSVSTAADSVVFYEKWLESRDGDDWSTSTLLSNIRDYNEEDCVSTFQLAKWLRNIRGDIAYDDSLIRKTHNEATDDEVPGVTDAAAALASELMAEADLMLEGEDKRVQQLLAGVLEFHAREQKPVWWEYFDRRKCSPDELFDDLQCLSGLRRTDKAPYQVSKSLAYEYDFDPDQDTKIQDGDKCRFLFDASTNVTVKSIDREVGKLVVSLGPSATFPPDESCIVLHDYVSARPLSESIYRLVASWRERRVLPPALQTLLYREEPRMHGKLSGEPVVNSSELSSIIAAIRQMRDTTICIQGPPGCGKTYTASHAIVALLKDGKRIGVTSNSHKVVEHLLEAVAKEARLQGVPFNAAKVAGVKPESNQGYLALGIEHVKDSSTFWKKNDHGESEGVKYDVVGGTAWFFCDENCTNEFDYLFVDEAGQVCMANILAMSAATSNIVLIGDQMQLEQPIRGSHPGETGQSALEFLLQDQATVPPSMGIFLGVTHRLHPELCQLISTAIYESRLTPAPENEKQRLIAPLSSQQRLKKSAGIVWVPTPHSGNVQASEEEVEVISQLVADLSECAFIDKHGKEHRVQIGRDIIIVAPYNMQVRLIAKRIPGVQVASVDKFQGREAPIVILSMCASEGNGSPRGADFLFNKSRLNVAISRAKTLAFVVGSPDLIKARCSTLAQMNLLNLFCHIVQSGSSMQTEKATYQTACRA